MATYTYNEFIGWINNTAQIRERSIEAKDGSTHLVVLQVEGETVLKPATSKESAQAIIRRELKKYDALNLSASGTFHSLTKVA